MQQEQEANKFAKQRNIDTEKRLSSCLIYEALDVKVRGQNGKQIIKGKKRFKSII